MVARSIAVLISAWTVTVGVAHADQRERHRHGHGHRPHQAVSYASARVVDVDPVWRHIRVAEPRQRCWTEIDYVESRRGPDRTGAALAGGVVGAAIGNQVGSGDGRVAATVIGAAAGAAVGYRIASHSNDRRVSGYPLERCARVSSHRHERRIDGYRVTYVYAGRHYTQHLPYDPGRRVRIRIDGRPQIVG